MVKNMKNLLLRLISLYQKIPGPWHSSCRHIPTCSNYAKEAIEEHGIIKGLFLSLKRILRCNPFGTYGYDPVPKKEKHMNKKIITIILILLTLLLTTGCSNDDMENIEI